ncbi:ERF family protein, partial [Klebsiella pneumoniae]|nr:ERF family protein [Klebsiella pneumoniae]
NKAQSIAFKYALFQLLCIPTMAVDPDGERPELDESGNGGIRPQEQARRLAKQAGATTGDKLKAQHPDAEEIKAATDYS